MTRRAALLVAALCALASCTSSPARVMTAKARQPTRLVGAADLLDAGGGVVWDGDLSGGSVAILRSTDAGGTWRTALKIHRGFGVVADYFLGADDAWAVDERTNSSTSVLRSTDGGQSWQDASVPGTAGIDGPLFETIGFADSRHGWLIGLDAVHRLALRAWRTDDGGATWTALPAHEQPFQGIALPRYGDSACPNFGPTHLTFVSEHVGWFTPGGCEHGAAHVAIWRTGDGGQSWHAIRLPAPTGGWGRWNVLDHGGTEVGAVVERGGSLLVPIAVGPSDVVVASSADAGRTWTLSSRGHTRGTPDQLPVAESFDAIDARRWVVAARGGLLETADAGHSWRFLRGETDSPDEPISFASLHDGYRGGSELVAAQHTLDGGVHWVSSAVPSRPHAQSDWTANPAVSVVTATGPRTVFAGGASGLRVSRDGGRTWTQVLPATDRVVRMDPVGHGVLFAVTDSALLRSEDAGRTWVALHQPDAAPVLAVRFVSASAGVATMPDGSAYRTTDAGRTWTRLRLPGGWSFADGSIASGSLCPPPAALTAIGTRGRRAAVFVSDDLGRTWRATLVRRNDPDFATGLSTPACAGTTVWAVGSTVLRPEGMGPEEDRYRLLRSVDNGRSWQRVAAPPVPRLSRLVALTATPHTIWATAQASLTAEVRVAVSTDGGRSWRGRRLRTGLRFGQWAATAAAGPSHAWVLVTGNKDDGTSTLLATTDGGHSWSRVARFHW